MATLKIIKFEKTFKDFDGKAGWRIELKKAGPVGFDPTTSGSLQ